MKQSIPEHLTRRVRGARRGNSLPIALIALMVGVLLIFPLLNHVGSSQLQVQRVETTLRKQYTSDAATEWGIWKLINDASLRDQVEFAGPNGITLTLPSYVNSLAGTVRVVGLRRAFNYALWSNGQTCKTTFDWSGANNQIIGDSHSNQEIGITGSGTVIMGYVEYVTTVGLPGNVTLIPAAGNPIQTYVTELGPMFNFADYAPGGSRAIAAQAAGKYHYYSGDMEVSGDTGLDGLYFIEGDLKTGGNLESLSGTATIVAAGTIRINGNSLILAPYVDQLALFSNKDYGTDRCQSSNAVIELQGNSLSLQGGYVYAPYGKIKLSGSGVALGSFIGDSIDLSGSGLTVQLPPPEGVPSGCKGYDVIAVAKAPVGSPNLGTTTTQSRVHKCGAGGLRVLSWQITSTSN